MTCPPGSLVSVLYDFDLEKIQFFVSNTKSPPGQGLASSGHPGGTSGSLPPDGTNMPPDILNIPPVWLKVPPDRLTLPPDELMCHLMG